jgi:hypothetical protein
MGEEDLEGRGSAGFTGGVGIGRKCLQMGGGSASNLGSLGALFGEVAEGKHRGAHGLFIGTGD